MRSPPNAKGQNPQTTLSCEKLHTFIHCLGHQNFFEVQEFGKEDVGDPGFLRNTLVSNNRPLRSQNPKNCQTTLSRQKLP